MPSKMRSSSAAAARSEAASEPSAPMMKMKMKMVQMEMMMERVRGLATSPRLRNAAFLAMNALMAAAPALAEEAAEAEEKGKIFDFNLTLPIIAIEFLLLMVTLDNIWFKPVAKVMDERDEAIRQKLIGVRDNSGEIKQLQEEAEAILKAARAETTAELNKMKRETAAELDRKLQESRDRIEKELADALANLEVQKEKTLQSLNRQVQELSDQIVAKVLPF
jgi:F-type H+-transporting ATPase subunit b